MKFGVSHTKMISPRTLLHDMIQNYMLGIGYISFDKLVHMPNLTSIIMNTITRLYMCHRKVIYSVKNFKAMILNFKILRYILIAHI